MRKCTSGELIRSQNRALRYTVSGIIAVLIAAALSADTKHPAIAMWSWEGADGVWNFAMLPDRSVPPYWTDDEVLRASRLCGVKSLKKYIASLPSGTYVTWRDLPPKHILIYPPKPISADIIEFAKTHDVNIEIWPTLYE